MSKGKKAVRKVVSGLSTAGLGSRGGAGGPPAVSAFIHSGATTSSATKARPCPESSLHPVADVCPPAVNRVFLK